MNAKAICSLISEHKIAEAKSSIDKCYGETLESKVALPILITLCRSVSQKDSCSVSEIFHITTICCKNLTEIKDTDKENVLLSLYHVIKYFCKRKLYINVLNLLDFIEKHFIDEKYKSDVYNYYITLFHNYIFQNAKDLSGNMLFNFISYSIRLHILLKNNDTGSFISKIKLYTSLFRHSTLNNTHRKKFCTDVIRLFDLLIVADNQNNTKELYTLLLSILNITICCLPTCEDEHFSTFVSDIFLETCVVMRKHCNYKEYLDCIDILESISQSLVKDLKNRTDQDIKIIIDTTKKIKALIRKRGSNPVVIKTYSHIAKIFRQLFEYLQNFKDIWKEYFPISIQIELLRITEVLGQYFAKNSIDVEKCCKSCKFDSDVYTATVITSCAGIFVIHSLRLEIDCPEEFHVLSLRCLTMCCKYLHQLKQENCSKYAQLWRIVGTSIYNTAVVLYRNKIFKFAKLYSHLFLKNLISFEDPISTELRYSDSLGAALNLYAVCCQYLKEKQECMMYLCLTMILSTEYKRKALQTLIVLKGTDPDNEEGIKSTNVHQVLLNRQDEIKEIYPSYEYNEADCEQLLMEELQYYYDNWKSKIPMSSVCAEICNISNSPINRTKCFAMSWEKTSICDPNFLKNVEDTINMIGDTSDTNFKVCLSVLYFIQYQCKMNEIIDKNIDDMNEAYIPLKSTPLQPYEEPPNPNDKCDIVPAYYNMKIDNLLKIYKILDNAFELWDILLLDKEELNHGLVLSINLGDFIKQTAFEYRMQQFFTKMLKTWILYYKFSKLLKNKNEIVRSIGFIFEYSDCTSKAIQALEEEAENFLLDFDKKDSEQLEICLTYHINKSAGYLKNDLIKEGYSELCIAEKLLQEIDDADLKTCEARILHLKTCFLLLPCEMKIMTHDENFLVVAQNSYTIIGEQYLQGSRKSSYVISVLFEIALANGWMYKWIRLPREVRCYSKDCVILAQKLVLPIQTAQFLSLLAFTDLLDMQYSDCEVKLNGLTRMLCYASNITYEKLPTRSEKKEESKEEYPEFELPEIDTSLPGIQYVLEAPAPKRYNNNLFMSSPELRRKAFVFPEFMKHPENCDCFMCSNSEYQKQVLNAIHLEALLTMYQNMDDQAKNYFKGGLTICEKLWKKSESSVNFSKNEIILTCVNKYITESYSTFLLDYSYFLCRGNAFSEARKVLDKIYTILTKIKNVKTYFLGELTVQRFNLIHIEQECIEDKPNNIQNLLEVPTDSTQARTPQNKVSAANIRLSVSPLEVPIPMKTFKKLKFDLSEDERDDSLPKTPEKIKNVFFKPNSPSKTPAPTSSKIKIYTPKTVKPKRTTSKSIRVPTSTPSSNSAVKKGTSNKQIEERMKLLTEKLKAENCKVQGAHEKQKENSVPIRKKLLNDLDAVTQSVDKLSIASNKKDTETLQDTQNLKDAVTRKKYTRIKIASSSSSSSLDSSSDIVGIRKSSRTRKTDKT